MVSLRLQLTTFTLSILASCASTQFVSSLPDCVQDCINNSQDDNCDALDLPCICKASAGNFLTDTVICIHNSCDNDLDNDLLLAPLQLLCDAVGTPIPESAIQNAESEASSLSAQDTVTVTMTPSATPATSILSTVTVTTTIEGSTVSEVYPITIGRTTTASGSPSTITSTSSAKSSTNSRSTITSSTTSTHTAAADLTSTSSNSKSSSTKTSKTSTASSGQETDSAPFTNTNDASERRVDSWLGLSALLVVSFMWF